MRAYLQNLSGGKFLDKTFGHKKHALKGLDAMFIGGNPDNSIAKFKGHKPFFRMLGIVLRLEEFSELTDGQIYLP